MSSTIQDPTQVDLEDPAVLGEHPENIKRKVVADGIAAERLRSIVERIERLVEEKKALSSDISDIFLEAKSAGFVVKAIRALLKIRGMEPADVEEQEALLDIYRRALGG